jgi:hypothetical protein
MFVSDARIISNSVCTLCAKYRVPIKVYIEFDVSRRTVKVMSLCHEQGISRSFRS